MRVQRLFLTIALATALAPGSVVRADLNHRTEITGAEDSDLAGLLDKVSELKTLEDKPRGLASARRPRSLPADRCRPQPRLLGCRIRLRHRHSDRPGKGRRHGQVGAALSCRLDQGAGSQRAASIDPRRRKEAAAQTRRPGAHRPSRGKTRRRCWRRSEVAAIPLPRWRTLGSRSTATHR
jgi:hypothetical protein